MLIFQQYSNGLICWLKDQKVESRRIQRLGIVKIHLRYITKKSGPFFCIFFWYFYILHFFDRTFYFAEPDI